MTSAKVNPRVQSVCKKSHERNDGVAIKTPRLTRKNAFICEVSVLDLHHANLV